MQFSLNVTDGVMLTEDYWNVLKALYRVLDELDTTYRFVYKDLDSIKLFADLIVPSKPRWLAIIYLTFF